MKSADLTEGPILKNLIRFAVPFFIANILQALYGAADLLIVGQFNTAESVSAVGIGAQVMHVFMNVFLGLSVGGTVLLAQKTGERNGEGAAKAVGTTATFFAMMAAFTTPLLLLGTSSLAEVMQTPPESLEATKNYIFICSCGIPFILGYNVTAGIFRGLGDSKTPVYFIALACLINIVFDLILVGRFGMAERGAAYATVVSQGISFCTAFFYMHKKGFPFPFASRHFRIDKPSLRFIVKVGTPLALQDGLVGISFSIINAIVNTMGLIASAAMGVVSRINAFALLPNTSIAGAVATMTAQNIGADQVKRANRTLACGIAISVAIGTSIWAFCQFRAETLTSVFSTDPAVTRAAALYLHSFTIDCILTGFIFSMNAYFCGCGRSLISMIHSLIATFLVRIPVSYAVSLMPGATMYEVGFAPPLASLLSVIICVWYFVSKRKTFAKMG